jgi:OOP family OmpA-OmpF porin
MRLMITMALAGLPMLAMGDVARADDILDPVSDNKREARGAAKKGAAKRSDKVEDAGSKSGSAKPGSSVPGSETPGPASPRAGNLEAQLNAQLLEAARQNQCNFKGDSEALAPGCDAKAQNLVEAIRDARAQLLQAHVKSFKFEISGHTDTRGNPAANKTMSEKRAAVMVKQLVAKGAPAGEMSAVGLGSEQPLVKPDNTPAKQALNRRYELRVRL